MLYIPGRGWSGRAPDGQAITKEEKKEIEETAERLAMEARTPDQEEAASARVFREIANTILPDSIRMKEDVPSAHQRRALPILDTEMWVENGRILHSHYSKPMASMEVILQRSAMTMSSKVNILVQEGARRIRNCSPNLPWMTARGFLNRLMLWGGYPERTRRIVADRILARHNNNMQNLQEHGRKLYRSKEDRANMEKPDKATWFRKAGATATLFVPTTPGS